ncbi:Regulatory protein SWI6 [Candida viswanathii]|uniref:Regulatory protein SWI6 n=1 Tax=Candida viswanathii TaxID=5486 RepID=A0A367Y3B3_9ASCO|nr:Regulatory protein SWI6 [Candida viswanathii]
MDSPIHIGDLTTQSIQQRLLETHINGSGTGGSSDCTSVSTVSSSIYSGIKAIQLMLKFNPNKPNGNSEDDELIILRRVQDSFVNVSQLFEILVKLGLITVGQLNNFFDNEILSNMKYFGSSTKNPQYLDLREHENTFIKGIWIPYDKAVELALKFDIYEITKKLFLVDVHDFDKLPKANKRVYEEDDDTDKDVLDSPSKKQKLDKNLRRGSSRKQDDEDTHALVDSLSSKNSNYPFTLPAVVINDDNVEIANDIKMKLGEVFKRDDEQPEGISFDDVKAAFSGPMAKYSTEAIIDIPLDQRGQTALHFASTLASLNLVSAFVQLGLNSPIRGNSDGESPLVSCIQVTNAMEKGNFSRILSNWLYPDVWLLDSRKRTIFHHLALQIDKNDSFKFYTTKILEYIIANNDQFLLDLRSKLLNAQDDDGNTALHIAIEKESKWFIKVLLLLGADVSIANKHDIKPSDFEIARDANSFESNDQIFDLISTGLEFLNKRVEIAGNKIPEIEEPKEIKTPTVTEQNENSTSGRIFQSIQQLLSNTNAEYESILNSKREQIKQLDRALHDATIVTANNRFNTKKITEKLIQLDNLKLQVANVTDKLTLSKQELDEEIDESKEYDADEPFVIKPIFDKLKAGELVEDLKNDESITRQLQPAPILRARINAYRDINARLEKELQTLVDYSDLTAKFKKVVSICTNVGINEVDEFLDGLLEAVEGQQ